MNLQVLYDLHVCTCTSRVFNLDFKFYFGLTNFGNDSIGGGLTNITANINIPGNINGPHIFKCSDVHVHAHRLQYHF